MKSGKVRMKSMSMQKIACGKIVYSRPQKVFHKMTN